MHEAACTVNSVWQLSYNVWAGSCQQMWDLGAVSLLLKHFGLFVPRVKKQEEQGPSTIQGNASMPIEDCISPRWGSLVIFFCSTDQKHSKENRYILLLRSGKGSTITLLRANLRLKGALFSTVYWCHPLIGYFIVSNNTMEWVVKNHHSTT